MAFELILILPILFYLGVEAGGSWPWSQRLFDKSWKQLLPEMFASLILAGVAMYGWGFDLAWYWLALIYLTFTGVIYGGIQAATWALLDWDKDENKDYGNRSFSLKFIVDPIARIWNWGLHDEGYSWVKAIVKGTIITAPLGGLGRIFFAFGYECGDWFKRKKRDEYLPKWLKPHAVCEGLSFAFVGVYALLFLHGHILIKLIF